MSNEFTVIDKQISTFTEVDISPNARIESNGNHLSAIFPANDKTKRYVVGQFQYDGTEDTVELPDDSIVLEVGTTAVTALVDKEQYAK
jgi:lipopolysaccharide export system protein LptA